MTMPRTDKLTHVTLLVTLFLVITGIAPFLYNMAISSKLLVLGVAAIVAGLIYAGKLLTEKKLEVAVSPLISVFGLFSLSVLVSVFLTNQYPVQNLFGLGGAQLACLLIVFFGASALAKESLTHTVRQNRVNQFIDVLLIAGSVIGFTSLLQLFGVGPSKLINLVFGLNLPNTILFNLASSAFVALQVGVIALVALIVRAVVAKQLRTLDMISIPFLLLTIGINIWAMLPGKPGSIILPEVAASWSIAIDALRTPRSALIGFGTDSYTDVYTRFKPTWINGRNYWQLNFGSATNYPLTVIATQGLLGLITWVLLFVTAIKLLKVTKAENRPIAAIVLATFVIQTFLPVNLVLLAIQAIGLIYWVTAQSDLFSVLQLRTQAFKISDSLGHHSESAHTQILPMIVGGLLIIALIFPGYAMVRAFTAFGHLYLADKAAVKNDAVAVYDQQRQAVVMLPYLDAVRRQYALTNIRIAVALSSNKNLTDTDRNQITELIRQAIREAQAATILDPNSVQNWVTLAEIYRNITGVAKEADQWTVNSMVSAIGTDPANPLLRIDLGRTFFDKAQYEDAARFFNQAIELKPDLAGGYFQLGRTLKEVGQLGTAKTVLEKSRSFVPADSDEYKIITTSISEVDAAIAATQSAKKAPATTPAAKTSDSMDATKKATGSALLNLTKNDGNGLGSVTEQNTKQTDADIVNNTQSESLKTPTPSP